MKPGHASKGGAGEDIAAPAGRRLAATGLLALLATAFATPAMAGDNSGIESLSPGSDMCAIAISGNGVIAADPSASSLGSRFHGGEPGSVDVYSSGGNYSLSIDAPLGFSQAPTGGGDGATFLASFSGFGATNFSLTPGEIPVRLKRGHTNVEIDLTVTRHSGPFPSGLYRADLVLRCE